ncbi:MAG TPA: hypothetical protein VH852_03020 [Hyphomicrobium sp.]|jgi:hypothetical protein
MPSAASLAATASVAIMLGMSGAASAMMPPRGASPVVAVVPAVSSNAHKGIGGRYGGYKSSSPKPGLGYAKPESSARKEPYPYPYYSDESRGNYGCHRLGRRAIETDNANWWARYRACIEAGSD